MKPAAFEYHAPDSLQACVDLLTELQDEEPKLLAGGQSLVPMMNLRLAQPEIVVDLNRLPGLSYIREEDGTLAIGAMTRYAEIEHSQLARRACPLLVEAIAEVGYPAVRNRGTIGGSLAHADPVAEMPCAILTLEGELVLTGASGSRTVPADQFFTGIFNTALEPTEVLSEVRLPISTSDRTFCFHEFARAKGDYAVVAVGVALSIEERSIASAAIGFANLADRPVRSPALEQLLVGRQLLEMTRGAPLLDELGRAVRGAHSADPFRLRLASVLVGRAVLEAVRRYSQDEA